MSPDIIKVLILVPAEKAAFHIEGVTISGRIYNMYHQRNMTKKC